VDSIKEHPRLRLSRPGSFSFGRSADVLCRPVCEACILSTTGDAMAGVTTAATVVAERGRDRVPASGVDHD
jgi:hypothetical protein